MEVTPFSLHASSQTPPQAHPTTNGASDKFLSDAEDSEFDEKQTSERSRGDVTSARVRGERNRRRQLTKRFSELHQACLKLDPNMLKWSATRDLTLKKATSLLHKMYEQQACAGLGPGGNRRALDTQALATDASPVPDSSTADLRSSLSWPARSFTPTPPGLPSNSASCSPVVNHFAKEPPCLPWANQPNLRPSSFIIPPAAELYGPTPTPTTLPYLATTSVPCLPPDILGFTSLARLQLSGVPQPHVPSLTIPECPSLSSPLSATDLSRAAEVIALLLAQPSSLLSAAANPQPLPDSPSPNAQQHSPLQVASPFSLRSSSPSNMQSIFLLRQRAMQSDLSRLSDHLSKPETPESGSRSPTLSSLSSTTPARSSSPGSMSIPEASGPPSRIVVQVSKHHRSSRKRRDENEDREDRDTLRKKVAIRRYNERNSNRSLNENAFE